MKSIKTLAVAAVLALTGVSMASAQTIYHLTGSTAYRNAVVAAEVQICGGTGNAYAIYFGSSSSTLSNANYSIIATGTTTSATVFENFWNGSIAGDQALTEPVSLNFPSFTAYTGSMTTATSGTVTSLTNASGGTQVASTSYTADNHAPDIAMSDVFFSTAQQIMKNASPADNTTPSGGTSAANTEVGVVPFVFVANGSSDVKSKLGTTGVSPATVSLSMDPQKFTYIWSAAGTAQLSILTANSTDTANIYPMGRDADSGTRSTALAETGFGLKGSGILTTTVTQFYPYNSDANYQSDETTATGDSTGLAGFGATTGVCGDDTGATSIAELEPVPYESVDGYEMGSPGSDGDGGYYSGGNLATGISTLFASSTANSILVTYLGVSDAKTALTGTSPAVLLAYCGNVFYPTSTLPSGLTIASNAAQIYYGKYTFWGYEHMYYLSTASSEATTLRTTLKTDLLDELSSNGVTLSGMVATRSGDGQNVQ